MNLRTLFVDLTDEVRGWPVRIHRWTVNQHRPVDLMEDGSVLWCRSCRKTWPCDEFVRLTDELVTR